MPELHLKQPGFTYKACDPFTKNKESMEKPMQSGNTDFIYRNELDKACFQLDMAYGKSKDLAKRIQSDKVLIYKAFRITSDPNHDGYQKGLTSMVYKFFDKKSSGSSVATEPNYQIINLQMNFADKLLESLRQEKSANHLETIFGVLI